ncbi:chromatin assembly factor 1 subunit, putative [Plasmodium ovale curtisi]|uniref:Chromatin assembly factor 1 subunit, putative n=2 Tax=Plasmodium ovale TaxID=36330 RepID=A0A1A8VZQ7_PLAOA|nr:chromatin assembly factor 1 subunit, putative [Plasmodium ovale curtisi]
MIIHGKIAKVRKNLKFGSDFRSNLNLEKAKKMMDVMNEKGKMCDLSNAQESKSPIQSESAHGNVCGSGNVSANTNVDIMNERYIIWRRNTPFLYSSLLKNKLEWPSLTVEFMGSENSFKSKTNYFTSKILLGTHTSNQDSEYVYIGEIKSPLYCTKEDVLQYENYTGFLSTKKKKKCHPLPSFEIKAKLLHPGEVIRATHLPSNSFFIVTQTYNGNILLFDYTKHPSFPSDISTCYPQMILKGHTAEGNGLCWNSNKIYDNYKTNGNVFNKLGDNDAMESNDENAGQINTSNLLLASCSADGSICLWDINKGTKSNEVPRTYGINKIGKTADYNIKIYENTPTLSPLCTWTNKNEKTSLNDIFFHPKYFNVLGVCDDNGYMNLYDIRKKKFFTKPEINFKDHNEPMNTFSFDHFSEYIFSCGYSDGLISIWDIRYNKESLLNLDYHTQSINRIKFCLMQSGIFGTCSDDGTACIWDISRNSKNYEQVRKLEDDIYNNPKKIPKQLLFVHGGHVGSVYDMSWANSNTFLVATVGADNSLQSNLAMRLTSFHGKEMALASSFARHFVVAVFLPFNQIFRILLNELLFSYPVSGFVEDHFSSRSNVYTKESSQQPLSCCYHRYEHCCLGIRDALGLRDTRTFLFCISEMHTEEGEEKLGEQDEDFHYEKPDTHKNFWKSFGLDNKAGKLLYYLYGEKSKITPGLISSQKTVKKKKEDCENGEDQKACKKYHISYPSFKKKSEKEKKPIDKIPHKKPLSKILEETKNYESIKEVPIRIGRNREEEKKKLSQVFIEHQCKMLPPSCAPVVLTEEERKEIINSAEKRFLDLNNYSTREEKIVDALKNYQTELKMELKEKIIKYKSTLLMEKKDSNPTSGRDRNENELLYKKIELQNEIENCRMLIKKTDDILGSLK